MKIGIVGYQGSGKSSLFHWLTGVEPDLSLSHTGQAAMATIPDDRVAELCEIYQPKKVTQAALEFVDTPGLSRDHQGSAQKLALIREAGCLVVVAADFGTNNAATDLSNFEDDLLIADLDIVSGRVERLKEQVKKPRPNRDELQKELEALEPLVGLLEDGKSLRQIELTPDQKKATRSFQLFSEKPRLVIVNSDDDDADLSQVRDVVGENCELIAIPLSLQLELAQMDETERNEFCEEMGVSHYETGELLRTIMNVSGQMIFFTAGEKEVRTWMLRRGGTAVEAAGNIHTDLAQGFIRAATMTCDDLIRLGSEREVKAANLVRQEPKDYVIQDGDIIEIRHN